MFCFVILHYKNLKDTIECITSIEKLKEKKKIIVVDNYTLTNKEKEQLKGRVDDLILLKENIGFAKANNQGCDLAIKKYHPDFLVVLNNDTCIFQSNFLKLIEKDYKTYHFAILGPKILTDSGDSVNPFPVYKDLETVNKKIAYSKRLITFYSHPLLNNFLQIYVWLKAKVKPATPLKNGEKLQKNVALHGCALIFSKEYYEKNAEIFDSRTFLFHEEEFLYQRMLQQKFLMLYDPALEIYHKEGSSLRQVFGKKERLKNKFKQEEIVKSLEILKQDMEKSKNKS